MDEIDLKLCAQTAVSGNHLVNAAHWKLYVWRHIFKYAAIIMAFFDMFLLRNHKNMTIVFLLVSSRVLPQITDVSRKIHIRRSSNPHPYRYMYSRCRLDLELRESSYQENI